MRYKKSAISASQIVDAAKRVIARQGYSQTSLKDIAAEAGMSKGAIHYHFPTKEVLVAKVLETATLTVAERTLSAWQAGGTDPMSALRAAVRELWLVRSTGSDEVHVISNLLAHALHDKTLRPQLADYYKLAAAQTSEHLVTALAAYGLRPRVSPELVPRLLLGLLDGLVLQVFVEPDVIDADELVRAVELIAGALFEMKPAEMKPAEMKPPT